MTSLFSRIVLAVSPGCGAEPSGPSSTRRGQESPLPSRAELCVVPNAPGFFLRLRGAQSAGRRRTWNIMEPNKRTKSFEIIVIYMSNETNTV